MDIMSENNLLDRTCDFKSNALKSTYNRRLTSDEIHKLRLKMRTCMNGGITHLQYLRMICKHKKPDNSTAFIDQNGELRCEICGVYKDEKGRIYIYEEDED